MDIPSASLRSHTHISPESSARSILTRVPSPKILKKSASPSTDSEGGIADLARETLSPWTSRASQKSSLIRPSGSSPGSGRGR